MVGQKILCKFLLQARTTTYGIHAYCLIFSYMIIAFLCALPRVRIYYMFTLIHAAPNHPYPQPTVFSILLVISYHLCYLILLLLSSLSYYHYHLSTAASKYISGAVELTTQLSKLINTLWLPLCRINKLG